MAARARTPNKVLARLMAEAGVGNEQFARKVNQAGAELGLRLHYDKSTVSHWLKGSVPKAEARPAVVEALSRLLGRPVPSAELGWGAWPGEEPDVASGVMELGRADMDPSRRSVLGAGLYSATLLAPSFQDLVGRTEAARTGRTVRIGDGDVETVRRMTDKVAEILDEIGAGHARPMAAAFLANTVGPYLRASGPERVRRDMRAAAADLVYLTGWMAMYEERQGLGQRYYVKALRLAGEAEDHVTYCRTLRGMSLQASHLGYGPKALELADGAAGAAPSAGPRLVAFLRGQQAHASAMVGDRHAALARLGETETALARADDRRDAVGGYDEAAYFFHEAHVRWCLGDGEGSVRSLYRSNAARAQEEREGRLHCLGVIAERQFRMRHVEAACATWHTFLDEHLTLSSARGDAHLTTLLRSLPPYRTLPTARDLEERARHIAALKAA
ncbi:hypothetical protein RND61_27690 [Streptomyces sp. TRM76323]|uniref:Regulatory protein n=1 Tax=Streptomyces tamarix TaxID=3078565 RepID=A0ABU3QTI3_9ACTN|nr:hypothetical protein [Streptomyces tamarix]MDT9685819.1 hypothetical protein [Streptomyces tamarix]